MCFGDCQRTQRRREVERNENERGSEMRRGWEMEVRQREGGGVGGGKSKRRAMRLGSRCGWGGGGRW